MNRDNQKDQHSNPQPHSSDNSATQQSPWKQHESSTSTSDHHEGMMGDTKKQDNKSLHTGTHSKPSTETLIKIKEFVIFMYMAIAALLGFRFLLSLLGADTRSGFVTFIYDVTYPPLLPFDGMFGRDLFRPS